MRFFSSVRAQRDGTYAISFSDNERNLIQMLVPQLRELVESRDPMAWRLFPNPHEDDPLLALQYEEMIGDDLLDKRRASIDTLERTMNAKVLSEEELLAWMTSVNDLRLVLGTRLDLTEESELEDFQDDEGSEGLFIAYVMLGMMLENIVSAL